MLYDTAVVAGAFSPDGKYVVSIGGTTARVWIYRPIDLTAESCSRVTRNLTRVEWRQYIGDVLPAAASGGLFPICQLKQSPHKRREGGGDRSEIRRQDLEKPILF